MRTLNCSTTGGQVGYMCTRWRNCSLPAAVRTSRNVNSATCRRGGLSTHHQHSRLSKEEQVYSTRFIRRSWNNSRGFPATTHQFKQYCEKTKRGTNIFTKKLSLYRHNTSAFMFTTLFTWRYVITEELESAKIPNKRYSTKITKLRRIGSKDKKTETIIDRKDRSIYLWSLSFSILYALLKINQ